MKIRGILLSVLLAIMASSIAFGQGKYVSQPAADAMKGGKFYAKLAGTQSYAEEDMSMTIPMEMELAVRAGVSMSRVLASGMNAVSLSKGQYNYVLDEAAKTWRGQPSPVGMGEFTELRFRRQGSCIVNGEQGWYFDEYSAGSEIITFYYNSDKPSILDLGGEGEEAIGPLWLHSFTKTIPSNMYFCVGNDWKDAGAASPGGAAAAAGVDFSAIEAQMRSQLKGQQLPPGMTIDDIINQARASMGGAPAGGSAASAVPAPPKCGTPWKDTETNPELACGFGNSKIVITEKRTLKDPVYASKFAGQAAPPHARTDLNVTAEGIKAAFEKINNDISSLSDAEVCNYFIDFDDKVNGALAAGVVTGEIVEMSVASSYLHPHPMTLATTAALYEILGDPAIAFDYYKAADQIEPDNIVVEHGMVDCLIEMNRISEARKVIPKIINVYPQDGYSYLKMAMLDIKEKEYYAAANDLFKSLSLGYFDENSATMITSLLSACDAMAVEAHDGLDFKNFIDHVFSEKNIGLLKKAIAYDYPSLSPSPSVREFNISSVTGNLANMARFNKSIADSYDQKQEAAIARSEKIAESNALKKPLSLYFAMGFGNAGDALSNITGSVGNLKGAEEAKRTLASHPVENKKGMESMARMQNAATGLEDAYGKLTRTWSMEDNVGGYYLPDSRAFWCLRAYYRCLEYRLMYAEGNLAHTVDRDGDGVPDALEGCYDQSLKTKFLADLAAQKKYDQKCKDAQERYEKMTPKTDEQLLKFMLLQLEDELDFKTEYYGAQMANYRTFYETAIIPVISEIWKEFTSLPQYCDERALQAYIENRMFADVFEIVQAPYTMAAGFGKDLLWIMDEIDSYREKLGSAKLKREAEQNAEVQAAALHAQDEMLFDHGTELRFSDFLYQIATPLGNLKIGMRDGRIGWMHENQFTGVRSGNFGGKEFTERMYKGTLADEAAAGAQAKNALKDIIMQNLEVTADMLAESVGKGNYLSAAKELYNLRQGKLFDIDRKKYYSGVIDSAGNLHQAETSITSVSKQGVTISREVTRIGTAKREKTLVNFGPFTVGGY